jgi:hypothetical protein
MRILVPSGMIYVSQFGSKVSPSHAISIVVRNSVDCAMARLREASMDRTSPLRLKPLASAWILRPAGVQMCWRWRLTKSKEYAWHGAKSPSQTRIAKLSSNGAKVTSSPSNGLRYREIAAACKEFGQVTIIEDLCQSDRPVDQGETHCQLLPCSPQRPLVSLS